MSVALVREYRGDIEECVHYGHICGVDDRGKIVYSAGNPEAVSFLRSSAKPFQAIPVVRHGADEHFGLTDEEAAIMMGSHRAEPFHVAVLESMLRKTGLSEEQLICHPTYPLSVYATEALLRDQKPKRSIYHNCSGKHLGILALCKAMGYPMDSYGSPEHPAQREILDTLAELAEVPPESIGLGTDGCGFPVFALSLHALAVAFLKLACPDLIAKPDLREAVVKIASRMNAHSEMVAGTDRICSSLLLDSNIVAKGGAKGVYGFSLRRERLAFSLKVEDGSEDEWPLIVASILEQIGYGNQETIDRMYELAPLEIRNDNRLVIGHNKPVFTLHSNI
ncbi:asparaginase [Paenibacillus glycanilyticus]|uniref:asparaginase n=1 Tax=Paenibacillus glycanilyticus TaxID=126569 RepID=UPI00203AB2A8|nr:asparaginase [Paenibacillus glycanilyticus]MCM3629717.1 asparaginase [Paenibacillus glycanilyticus]